MILTNLDAFLFEADKLRTKDGKDLDEPYRINETDVRDFLAYRYPHWKAGKNNDGIRSIRYGRQAHSSDSESGRSSKVDNSDSDDEDMGEITKSTFKPKGEGVRFDDLVGVEAVKEAFNKAVLPYKYPKSYMARNKNSKQLPNFNFLLHGPTGTGKSTLVDAITQQLADLLGKKIPVFKIDGNAISLGASSGASAGLINATRVFNQIKQITDRPVVLNIEELDALVNGEPEHSRNSTLKKTMYAGTTKVQTEMDKLRKTRNLENAVIVVATTHHIDEIPGPTMRRYNYQIAVGETVELDYEKLFQRKFQEKDLEASDALIRHFATKIEGKGFKGADIDDLTNYLQNHLWEKESNKSAKENDPDTVWGKLKPTIADIDAVVDQFPKTRPKTTEAEKERTITESRYQDALAHLDNLEDSKATTRVRGLKALDELDNIGAELDASKLSRLRTKDQLDHMDGENAVNTVRREEAKYRLNSDMKFAIKENEETEAKKKLTSTHA